MKRVAMMTDEAEQKMDKDPWKPISLPDQTSNVSGRRVDPNLPWGMFWAVDVDRNCLLILQHDPVNKPEGKLPKLRGLEVEMRIPETGADSLLVIRLTDDEQREIFHRLCLDIISSTRQANTEKEAVERFLARTWRWHRLLRGGQDGRLSSEEQKGLIGELSVLQQVLMPNIGVRTSVKGWTGPLGAPKDFEIGRVCIEAKARRGAATPFVTISNEHQLDTSGVDALILHVSEVTAAGEDDKDAVTVTDMARMVLQEIETLDASISELFEERLAATGFDWTDDYSDRKWLRGPDHTFEVTGDFPRVTPDMYPTGVGSLRYAISLPDCEPHRIDAEYVNKLIAEGAHGDRN